MQDVWLTKVYTKKIEAEEAVKNAEREKKEAEIEAKRLETERRKAEGLVDRNPNTAKRKKQKSGKQEQLEKANEWQKKKAPADEKAEYEPSRVGNRRYARGRAYDPDRYEAIPGEADSIETEDLPKGLPGEMTDTDIQMLEAIETDNGTDSGSEVDDEAGAEDAEEYNDDEDYEDADEDDDYDGDDYEDDEDDEDYEDYEDDDDDYADDDDDEDDDDDYVDDDE